MSATARTLSTVWFAMALPAPLLTAIVFFVAEREPDLPVWLPAVLVATVGLATSVAVHTLERILAATPPGDLDTALNTIRARRLLQWAIAQTPLLVGVVMTLALGPPWVVLIGALGVVEPLLFTRPRRAQFARLERAWERGGVTLPLTAAFDGDH